MSFDDRLRDALDRAAPSAPDPASVRIGLGSAMTKARRRHRVRRTIAAASLTVGVMGGTAVAAVHLIEADNMVDTVSTLPVPGPDGDTAPAPEPTSPPRSTASPTATTPVVPETTVPDPTPTSTLTPTPTPTPTPSTTSASLPPTTKQPPDTLISGPHETECGTVTFIWSVSVSVRDHTSNASHQFSTEGEGTGEVEAKWSEGPEDECQVAAHLENGELEIQIDDDDQP